MVGDLAVHWQELSQSNEELSEDFASQDSDRPIPPFFFHYFRPNGVGLKPYFDGYPYGDEIYQRIMEIYDVTLCNDPSQAYFTVNSPDILTKDALTVLGEHYVQSLRNMLSDMKISNVISQEKVDIHIIQGRCPSEAHKIDTAYYIYELKNDYFNSFKLDSEFMSLYRCDCIYYMTCSYDLVYYVLWPLISEQSAVDKPYDAGFNLWKSGADTVFIDNKTLNIYVEAFVE